MSRISFKATKKVPNAGTFTIDKEVHTIGNMLRLQMGRDTRVLFSGYRQTHPLETKTMMLVRLYMYDVCNI